MSLLRSGFQSQLGDCYAIRSTDDSRAYKVDTHTDVALTPPLAPRVRPPILPPRMPLRTSSYSVATASSRRRLMRSHRWTPESRSVAADSPESRRSLSLTAAPRAPDPSGRRSPGSRRQCAESPPRTPPHCWRCSACQTGRCPLLTRTPNVRGGGDSGIARADART